MELDFLVVDVGHEVEGRVDDLELDQVFILALVHVRLGDVDDDAERELLVALVLVLGGVGLR